MYSFRLKDDELILKKDMANLQTESTHLTGAFYLTTNRLVFIGYLVDATQKFIEEVSFTQIREIRPEKTFGLLSNVLRIIRNDGTNIKILIKKRDDWMMEIHSHMKKNGFDS
ncbi:MAG: hypothetical protein H6Q66_2413 [Firmicutes bacterium]|nr:hypothetical protein [Bacillota bacterium]